MNIVKCFHADHNVPSSLQQWAVEEVKPNGFFLRTLTIPAEYGDLTNNLYGPVAGDEPVQGEVLVRDENDASRQATPFIDAPPRPTRLLTLIGMAEGENVTLFTCYGGPAAERIPSDPSLASDPEGKARAEAFWAQHALSIAAKK
jgi:hypothetical protein